MTSNILKVNKVFSNQNKGRLGFKGGKSSIHGAYGGDNSAY